MSHGTTSASQAGRVGEGVEEKNEPDIGGILWQKDRVAPSFSWRTISRCQTMWRGKQAKNLTSSGRNCKKLLFPVAHNHNVGLQFSCSTGLHEIATLGIKSPRMEATLRFVARAGDAWSWSKLKIVRDRDHLPELVTA